VANKDVEAVKTEMNALADPERASHSQRFFKTGPGEYGQGDCFLGITVPETRMVARRWKQLPLTSVRELLDSGYHEMRLLALVIMVEQFRKADPREQERIYDFYMQHRERVNNWDLVDTSAPAIVGGYLENRSRKILYQLARSGILWERRIAVLATFYFIRNDDFTDALELARILVDDPEDLIHKALGWMLREIGNRDRNAEEVFLKRHYRAMPRTMLRYAIEKFPETLRQRYLKGKVTE